MCNSTIKQIGTLIRARTPVIAIESAEEARVEAELRALIHTQGKRLLVWSIALGFRQILPEESQAQPSPDPVASILQAAGLKQAHADPTVIIMKDLHPYLSRVPQAARAMRDAVPELAKQKSTIIMLGVGMDLPADLKKAITIVDFPMPSQGELEEQVDLFIASLPPVTSDGMPITVNLNGSRPRLVRALAGLTRAEADAVLRQAVISHGCLDERAIAFVLKAKAGIIKESGALEYYAERATYEDIGGLDLLKAWAKRARKASSPEARAFGIDAPKGVFLVGIPGCGKSLSAKAFAQTGEPLIKFNLGATQSKFVGETGQNLRQALKVAEAVSPCVLWIDEIDKVLSVGGPSGEATGSLSFQILGELLTWMQEHKDNGVFIVATANYVAGIDPALIRRFDRTFFVDFPTPQERAEILIIHLNKRNRDTGSFDVQAIVDATDSYTGSEIEQLVNEALIRAFDEGHALSTADLLTEAANIVPLAAKMRQQLDEMRAWAEQANPASSAQPSGHRAPETATLAGMMEL